jgi:hypothetical protein
MSYELYRAPLYQRGYGLGGTFRKFFSWIVPLVRKHAVPALELGLKTVGHTALSTAADIAKDVVSGKNVREAAEERINSAVDSLRERAENKLEGRGIKRQRKSKKFKKYIILKKQQKSKDIFD